MVRLLYGVVAGYIVLVSIVSLVSVALLGDRTGKDLAEIDQMGARVVPVVPAAA